MAKLFKKSAALLLSGVLVAALALPALDARALQYTGTASYMSGKYYQALREVTLTGEPRTDMVAIARSQLGYQEGGSPNQLSGQVYGGVNHTEYGAWYGAQDMWCAMFVSWCAKLAGVSTDVIPKHSFTPDGLQWFSSRGQAHPREEVATNSYTPRPGDLVYFKSSRNARTTNHVGLVTGYHKGRLYTIEGNVGTAGVTTNGGAVVAKSYPISNTYIVYICAPDYETVATNVQESPRLQLRNKLVKLEAGGGLGYDAVSENGSLGIGQWYGAEALDLLLRIRRTDEAAFRRLDTAGIGTLLDENRLPTGDEGCLAAILSSRAGVQAQEAKLDEMLAQAMEEARSLGVTEEKALLLCGAIGYLGGNGTLRRCKELAGSQPTEAALLDALAQVNPLLHRSLTR